MKKVTSFVVSYNLKICITNQVTVNGNLMLVGWTRVFDSLWFSLQSTSKLLCSSTVPIGRLNNLHVISWPVKPTSGTKKTKALTGI